MLSRLRQRRYIALTALMLVIAAICIVAGTWQVNRFEWKVRANDQLRGNANRAPVPVSDVLPLTTAPAPGSDSIKFRTVTATGGYDTARQMLVDGQTIDTTSGDDDSMGGTTGYFVLTPFKTATAYLLVVRGFIAQPGNGSTPVPALAPSGTVTISGRVEPVGFKNEPAQLGAPVFAGYVELLSGQPGSSTLTPIPSPSLSNPAGGAQQWQHFAYIIQWYLFAILALVAPLAISRHETREAQRRFLGIDPDAHPELDGTAAPGGAIVLAGRRPGTRGALARRGHDALVVRSEAEQAHIEHATAMADRYGLKLEVPEGAFVPIQQPPPDPVRDEFHGAYNDYLWELALADGDIPEKESSD